MFRRNWAEFCNGCTALYNHHCNRAHQLTRHNSQPTPLNCMLASDDRPPNVHRLVIAKKKVWLFAVSRSTVGGKNQGYKPLRVCFNIFPHTYLNTRQQRFLPSKVWKFSFYGTVGDWQLVFWCWEGTRGVVVQCWIVFTCNNSSVTTAIERLNSWRYVGHRKYVGCVKYSSVSYDD